MAKSTDVSFAFKDDGVYKIEHIENGKDEQPTVRHTKICSPLKIEALTRNDVGESWGRLVKVKDPDGQWHEQSLSMTMLASSDGRNIFEFLLNSGLQLESNDRQTRDDVCDYLLKSDTPERVLCVPGTGWYQNVFVLPDIVLGKPDQRIVIQLEN